MPTMEGTAALKTAQAEYDFAVDGGAVGTINLRSPGDAGLFGNQLPAGAVVVTGFIDVETAVASATGTVALTAETSGDVLAATTQAGLTVGRKSILLGGKTTVARSLTMTIATAATTAGKFRVVVHYK